MEKVSDKFTEELDIEKLLHKVRVSYGVIKNLIGPNQRKLIKFHKEQVIHLTEHSDSSIHSSSEEASLDEKLGFE